MANFILDSNSIFGTNSIIKRLDSLIREDIFPRNAWDTPKQSIDENGQLIVDWKIDDVNGLKIIRFAVDDERVARLAFYNGSKFSYFDYDSKYEKKSWLVQQQMVAFHDFFTSYLKRVESN